MIRHLDMDTIHKELEQVPEYEKQIMLQVGSHKSVTERTPKKPKGY